MKKWICMVLFFCLICGCVPALAEKISVSPVPEFNAADYPEVKPIDASDKKAAKKQMEEYCRALLSCPVIGLELSDAPAAIDWNPPENWDETVYAVYLYTVRHEKKRSLSALGRFCAAAAHSQRSGTSLGGAGHLDSSRGCRQRV